MYWIQIVQNSIQWMSLVNIMKDFLLFIPCVIDNKIRDSKPTKCTNLFLRYFCCNITLNSLNAELNPICHLLALLGAHRILHVSRIRVNIPTRFYPQGTDTRESNKEQHHKTIQSLLYTADVLPLCWLPLSTQAAFKILYIRIQHIHTKPLHRNVFILTTWLCCTKSAV
jgi:hypothetical protein